MTAKLNRQPTLDEVLADIVTLQAPPVRSDLREWINHYPQFKTEIIDFVTDWADMETFAAPVIPTEDEVDLIVNRTMSRVQQIMDEETQRAPLTDLLTDIKAVGYDFESFQRQVGIDRSLLTCLANRFVRPSTIPSLLITLIATALNRRIETVRKYFLLPIQINSAAYKSKSAPKPHQQDFSVLVGYADLEESKKSEWISQPSDPELGG